MSKKFIYLMSFILLFGTGFSNIASATQGPVGWWKLDGDANDSSGLGHHGVRTSNRTPQILPAYIAGATAGDSSNSYNAKFYPDDNAVDLIFTGDGENHYIDLNAPGIGTPAGTGEFIHTLESCTFTIWVNFRQPDGGMRNSRFFDFGTSATNYMFLRPRFSSSPPLHFEITTGGTTNRVGYGSNGTGVGQGSQCPTYVWCHVAATISEPNGAGLRTYKLYLNGVQVGINGSCTLTPASISPIPTISWLGRSIDPAAEGQYIRSWLDDFRIYDRQLSLAEVRATMGYPIATFPYPGDPNSAFSPTMAVLPPATTDVTLSWTKGAFASDVSGHHVYVGTVYADVNNGTGGTDKGLTSNTSYPLAGPNAPAKGVVYYWRVDEVNSTNPQNPWRGRIWSFRISPKFAVDPIPADGATLVPPKMTLRWSAGDGATRHDVYFGSSSPPAFRQSLTAPRSDPNWSPYRFGLNLEYNKTYYWQIKEFDGTNTWDSPIWSFKTVPNGPSEPNLVCWWKFNNDPCDAGFGCHGTAVGGPSYAAGYFDNAMVFNNANNTNPDDDIYVSVPIGYVISSLRASTFAMWVNWLGGGGRDKRFFSFGTAPANHLHFSANISQSAPMHFSITTPGSSPQVGYGGNAANTGSLCPTDGWHHVAVTIAEPNVTTGVSPFLMYLDGVLVGWNYAANRNPSSVGVTTFNWIGRPEDPMAQRPYNGSLDDVRIYDKALTLEEIQIVMFGDPNLATKPSPVNWSVQDVEKAKPLSWKKGLNVNTHRIYFGTDETTVLNADTNSPSTIYRGSQAKDVNTYTPPETFEMDRTYYWRVDEVNGAKVWKGYVWRFTTAVYLIIDDFESYTNTSPNRIQDTWKSVGGGKAGYSDVSYAEIVIPPAQNARVYAGGKALPFDYNNLKSPYDSNVYRDFSSTQDWTRRGVKALSLRTRGNMASVGSFTKSDPNYIMTASGTDFNIPDWRHPRTNFRDEFHYAYVQVTGECEIIAKVVSLTAAGTAQSRAGLMLRHSLNDNSAYALITRFSGSAGISFEYRPVTGQVISSNGRTLALAWAPYWLWLRREFNGDYYEWTAYYSANGSLWSPLVGSDEIAADNSSTGDTVYIGLAVTSRNASQGVTAVFSDIDIRDGGMGDLYWGWPDTRAPNQLALPSPWTSHQDIGVKSNTFAPLYVTLQDGGTPAKSATVINTDPNDDPNVLATAYQEWRIPLVRFSGIDLTKVKKITIGVGPGRSVLPHIGIGTMYIDNVSLYIPGCLTGRPRAAADFTGSDCVVGYPDLQTLTNYWLLAPPSSNPAVDMDGSGKVDVYDYASLAGMWLDQVLWPPQVTTAWGYEFSNDANCYTGTVTDANDLHLEFNGAVYILDAGPFFTTFAGNGTSKITLSGGTVAANKRVKIWLGCTGAEKTLGDWWWTQSGVRTSKIMSGTTQSCKKQ